MPFKHNFNGVYDVEEIQAMVIIGDRVHKKGDIGHLDGTLCDATVNVKTSPGITYQSVSLPVLLQKGRTMKSVQSKN